MLINSLFMINETGDIFMEKHWKSVINRSICDYFFEAQKKATSLDDVPPVIATPHYYLVSIYRNKMYLVSVIQSEVPPLFVIEFLHRIMDIFTDYFGECNEVKIKEYYVIVYELLEEVLDSGFPLATESNVLKELIKPPGLIGSVVRAIKDESQIGTKMPSGQLSNVPWRRSGVKYLNNEIYFDLIEEISCIVDKQGTTVFSEITGNIQANSQLSGMPDLVMTFTNPRIIEDVSLHSCIRYRRWEAERVLAFIPPDGQFCLLTYHLTSSSSCPLPIYVTPQFSFGTGSGRMDIRVGPKQTMGKTIEDVELTITFSKDVGSVNYSASLGHARYDPSERIITWKIGKMDPQKYYALTGTVSVQGGSSAPESYPSIDVKFKIPSFTASGIKVSRLDIHNEKYKAFKGIKYMTKAGNYQVRS